MKKIIFSALSVALLAGGMASCGKSSKGKMSNDWKVTSYEQTETTVDEDGDKSVTTTSANESTVTMTTTDTPSGGSSNTSTQNGTMNDHQLSIKKDGTFTWTRDVSVSQNTGGNTITSKTTYEQTGTWSFVGKSKDEDFKKNERVLFNVLTESSTTTQTLNQTTQISSNTYKETYLTGENVMIYTITESKGKELQLEEERSNSSTSNSEVSTHTVSTKVTLKEK